MELWGSLSSDDNVDTKSGPRSATARTCGGIELIIFSAVLAVDRLLVRQFEFALRLLEVPPSAVIVVLSSQLFEERPCKSFCESEF